MSLRYELTGGFIKNAILSALSIAVSRDGETPLITQDDLLKGASLQLRGRLRMKVCTLRELIKESLTSLTKGQSWKHILFVVVKEQHVLVCKCLFTYLFGHLQYQNTFVCAFA